MWRLISKPLRRALRHIQQAPGREAVEHVLDSRVARRLLGLFVLTAFVPLAVSGWLSSAAVGDLVSSYSRRYEARATQQVSLQVFDRLLNAKTLMQSWPAKVWGNEAGANALPGLGRVFVAAAHLDRGAVQWASPRGDALLKAWTAARRDDRAVLGRQAGGQSGETLLRVWFDQGVLRVLMGLRIDADRLWVAEIAAERLWQPLDEASIGSRWTVFDDQRQPLRIAGDLSRNSQELQTFEERLFLGAEFASTDWIFQQERVGTTAVLQGRSLSTWLALVAGVTVLVVTLISLAQIRRTLVPLRQLTASTRRLAQGDTAARVPVQGRDEFGALAQAFNDMAGRIEAQFSVLEGLAHIDRDILAGVAIEQVVDRVLAQLSGLFPSAWSAVAWTDPTQGPAQAAGMVRAPGASVRMAVRQLGLESGELSAFTRLAADTCEPRKRLARQPWCALVRQPGVRWLVLLPVAVQEGTQALLMLGLADKPDPNSLLPARELRDRLAVALAARQRERALAYQAVHDSLTGLVNRHGLHQALQAWLEPGDASQRTVGRGALLFVDLDHFKHINDSLGHDCGDQVLREAANRLLDCLRESMPAGATVARPGGDEFVLVVPGADAGKAREIAQDVLNRLRRPFELNGAAHVLGASIGVALAPVHGLTAVDLLRHADLAMYAAKQGGRHQAAVFEPEMDAQAHRRVHLTAELRRAVTRREFVPFFQPRVRPTDRVITSAEALVRWQHPTRGLLAPGEFIALAETSDELIEGIGVAMLDGACAQMAQWRRAGVGLPRVSVNVSTRQLTSGRVLGQVRAALARHGLPPQALELEVTESLLMGDVDQACAQLAELRRWGVTIALDDFGTGYSSMAMLRQLPIDVIKIDRAFVKDLGRDEGALAIARAIVALARSLKLHLVAEGIETPQQASVLRELGCDELQGYLYSAPVDADRFARLPGLPRLTSVPELA